MKDKNPFNDAKVREAMELALDREAIKRVVMRGQSLPTGVANPPFVNGWTKELDAFRRRTSRRRRRCSPKPVIRTASR